jgi:hypothetical protein
MLRFDASGPSALRSTYAITLWMNKPDRWPNRLDLSN